MRILVISQYFFPETFRINDIVKGLVKRSHDVTVLTGLPNYPDGKIYCGYEKRFRVVENYCGSTVYRCKLRPRKNGKFNLVLNYLSFIKQANKSLKTIDPNFDIIFFYEPSPIFSGIPAIKYGKKHHIKTVIYNMDLWPESIRKVRPGYLMSVKNPIYLIVKLLSKKIYNSFDLVINKCDDFELYLNKELNVSKSKMKTIYEHAEDVYLNVHEVPIDNGIIDFMFLGNVGQSQNCEMILRAFSKVQSNNCALHFVGSGSDLDRIKQLSKQLRVEDRVFFYGQQPLEEVIKFYDFADVCLLTLSNDTICGLTPPGKLFSYLAASRPILASINGSSRQIINDAESGFCVADGDINGFAEHMKNIVNNPDCLKGMGIKGREYFLKRFTLDAYITLLEKEFENIK